MWGDYCINAGGGNINQFSSINFQTAADAAHARQLHGANRFISNSTQRAPVAIAATSRNDQVDQLANNVYMGRQAQLMLDTYSQSYQTAPRATVEESAQCNRPRD